VEEMTYFKIGEKDFSMYVNALKVKESTNYNAQTNAAGDTVVDYINKKRTIEVGIIPLNDDIMAEVKTAIASFNVSLSFLNPETKELAENVNCIIPSSEVDYYTIQVDKTMFKAMSLTFTEL
jgi:hypothetical protein